MAPWKRKGMKADKHEKSMKMTLLSLHAFYLIVNINYICILIYVLATVSIYIHAYLYFYIMYDHKCKRFCEYKIVLIIIFFVM